MYFNLIGFVQNLYWRTDHFFDRLICEVRKNTITSGKYFRDTQIYFSYICTCVYMFMCVYGWLSVNVRVLLKDLNIYNSWDWRFHVEMNGPTRLDHSYAFNNIFPLIKKPYFNHFSLITPKMARECEKTYCILAFMWKITSQTQGYVKRV